jgi:tetratricopeptide (TPR) repeat protein
MTMSEDTKANDAVRETDTRPVYGKRKERTSFVTLLLVALVVALFAVLGVIILTPPEEPEGRQAGGKQYVPADANESRAANAGGAVPGSSALQAARRDPTAPALRLPLVAVPMEVDAMLGEAEKVAQALRQTYPQSPEALHVLALLESRVRRSEKAESLWKKCIELDPQQVAYYVNLAAIAMDRGDSELAVETLQQAIEAGLASPDVYHHLAVALTKLGRCEEAEETIQKALDVYPDTASYWTVLGQAQLKLGKAAEAEESLEKALELGSRTERVYFALGNACARQGKQEEAAKYRARFQEMKKAQPLEKEERYQVLAKADALQTSTTILCEAAGAYRDQGDMLPAERLSLRAAALQPNSPTPYALLADIYRQRGMLPEARAVRERLIELQPLQLIHYLVYAKLSAELSKPAAAEGALKLAMAIRPDAIEVYASLAQLYLQEGKPEQARWCAQEAVERQPSAEGFRFLARICEATGDAAGEEAALAKAKTFSTGGPEPTPQSP